MGSYTHPDAEVIAATVAAMPDSLGGIRMAIQVAELARAGMTPDWMPGVVPRCVPVEIKTNQHGERATTIVVGSERVRTRGRWRTVELLACPVTWRPNPEQIASARRGYEDWWQALDWVRDGLIVGRTLREVEVTGVMPRRCLGTWGEIDHEGGEPSLAACGMNGGDAHQYADRPTHISPPTPLNLSTDRKSVV